jgi:hypothetical protein
MQVYHTKSDQICYKRMDESDEIKNWTSKRTSNEIGSQYKTKVRVGRLGSIPGRSTDFLLFTTASRPGLRSTQFLILWVSRAFPCA